MARKHKESPPPTDPADAVDVNAIVAYNFRRARELRGMTQDQAAAALERFTGVRVAQAAISAMERAVDGEVRREFDAQELFVFARAFDVPIIWFFLPPPGDRRPLRQSSDHVDELFYLTMGYPEQLGDLHARLAEIGPPEPEEADEVWERVIGQPTPTSADSYQRRRKEAVMALLSERADELDRAADELGKFFDHLRQVGIRGFVAEHTMDSDYARPPKKGGRER